MKETQEPKAGKKPYSKPRLRVIRLSADEVLVTGCKQGATPGVSAGLCLTGPCSSTPGT